MNTARKAVLIETNFASLADAEKAGRALVEERLAAAVNITPGLVSIYSWRGTVERAEEVRLVVKTLPQRADAVVSRLAALHPYETPAMLVVPVEAATQPYFDWLGRETVDKPARQSW